MAGISLSAVQPTAETVPTLTAVDQDGQPLRCKRDKLPPLVIARRSSDGALVLAREITRKGKDGAPDTLTLKATALLADMADAVAHGLLAP